MITAVPDLLSSMNSRSNRRPSVGSTLPVGSSASNRCGREITRPRDRRALLFAAGQDRRQGVHPLAKTDPFQEVDDLLAIARFPRGPSPGTAAPHFRKWSCGRAGESPAARCRSACADRRLHPCRATRRHGRSRLTRPRVGPQRQEQQPQQRGLAGA